MGMLFEWVSARPAALVFGSSDFLSFVVVEIVVAVTVEPGCTFTNVMADERAAKAICRTVRIRAVDDAAVEEQDIPWLQISRNDGASLRKRNLIAGK